MLKMKFDTTDFNVEEIVSGFQTRFKALTATMMEQVKQEGPRFASTKLKSGMKHWEGNGKSNGFKVHKVNDDFYVISVEGMLANWMEQGIKTGEVSKAIMNGNRAETNKGQGKDYVDVPIAKNADMMGNMSRGKKGGGSVNIAAFSNAAQLSKAMNTSDWKRGGIKQKQITQSRVKDIIKMTEAGGSKASYVTIRRVTEDSKWPKSPYKGADVLGHLDEYIDTIFTKMLERLM